MRVAALAYALALSGAVWAPAAADAGPASWGDDAIAAIAVTISAVATPHPQKLECKMDLVYLAYQPWLRAASVWSIMSSEYRNAARAPLVYPKMLKTRRDF